MAIRTPQRTSTFTPIPESFIASVQESVDIARLIEVRGGIKLKKTGKHLVACCPFHTEKSPSFSVTPEKGMYKCFGCGAVGGALTFLMEHAGLPFREAVIELAEMANMPLPPEMTDASGKQKSIESAPLYAATELGQRFFRHVLKHDPIALAYLKKRGLTIESIRKFGIGAAPDEWRGLKDAFPDYETNPHLALAGLVRDKESEDGSSRNRYDFFRGRLMFPVRDSRGRIMAFGGRILGDGEPKYLNSPETPIFNKSGALYGLYEARQAIRRDNLAIAVEGYMDVVSLSQFGIENVVATMGTSMSRFHIERLLTLADTVVFAFDGDAAGMKAAWRALEAALPILEDHHDLRFFVTPAGSKDPDELVRAEGAEAFKARIRTAPSLSEFLIGQLSIKHHGLSSAEDRARFADEASTYANRLNWKHRLRKILLADIAREAQIPGSVIQSLRAQSATRLKPDTLWSRLATAAHHAPLLAHAHKDVLIGLLDEESPDEAELIQILSAVDPSEPGTEPADARYLIARDLLNSAVDMITELRLQQCREAYKLQYQSGEITEAEYIRQTLSLG